MKELRIYGYDLPTTATDEEVITRGEELGEVYTRDNFFNKLNNDDVPTSDYNYRAIEVQVEPRLYISKVVYSEMCRDEYEYLSEHGVIRYTDYNTEEILASDVQELLKEMQELEEEVTNDECNERLIELREIRSMLNESLGSDVVDLLNNNKIDVVMVIQ